MSKSLKQTLHETNVMDKFYKGFALVKEESEIANRGEFSTNIDIEYLAQGCKLLAEFKDELEKLLK